MLHLDEENHAPDKRDAADDGGNDAVHQVVDRPAGHGVRLGGWGEGWSGRGRGAKVEPLLLWKAVGRVMAPRECRGGHLKQCRGEDVFASRLGRGGVRRKGAWGQEADFLTASPVPRLPQTPFSRASHHPAEMRIAPW